MIAHTVKQGSSRESLDEMVEGAAEWSRTSGAQGEQRTARTLDFLLVNFSVK
jgi:hypothetical protein